MTINRNILLVLDYKNIKIFYHRNITTYWLKLHFILHLCIKFFIWYIHVRKNMYQYSYFRLNVYKWYRNRYKRFHDFNPIDFSDRVVMFSTSNHLVIKWKYLFLNRCEILHFTIQVILQKCKPQTSSNKICTYNKRIKMRYINKKCFAEIAKYIRHLLRKKYIVNDF